MYVNFLSTILTKSPAIPQQLYKPASRSLSAIAELLVTIVGTCFSADDKVLIKSL